MFSNILTACGKSSYCVWAFQHNVRFIETYCLNYTGDYHFTVIEYAIVKIIPGVNGFLKEELRPKFESQYKLSILISIKNKALWK